MEWISAASKWVNENPGLAKVLALVLTAMLAGLGFLAKRLVTGERYKERAESLDRALQIQARIDAAGMTLEDAVMLRDAVHGKAGAFAVSRVQTVAKKDVLAHPSESSESTAPLSFGNTTVGISRMLDGELRMLEVRLENTLDALAFRCSEDRKNALEDSQKAWRIYCTKEAQFAALLFEGGTATPLAFIARKIELTEKRLASLQIDYATAVDGTPE